MHYVYHIVYFTFIMFRI